MLQHVSLDKQVETVSLAVLYKGYQLCRLVRSSFRLEMCGWCGGGGHDEKEEFSGPCEPTSHAQLDDVDEATAKS